MAELITFQEEPFHIAWPEMELLFHLHWEQVALNQNTIKLNPYFAEYRRLAEAEMLQLITCRANGSVVGYTSSIVSPLLHYQHIMAGNIEMYFLHPDYRKGWTGYKLLRFTRDILLKRCNQIATTTKVHLDNTKVLERLGFTLIEKRFTLTK